VKSYCGGLLAEDNVDGLFILGGLFGLSFLLVVILQLGATLKANSDGDDRGQDDNKHGR
jgi:hypothetical protein